MGCTRRKFLLLLYICSSIALAGCQTNPVDETAQDMVPKRQWAIFPALNQKNYAKEFPSGVRLTSIDGQRRASRSSDGQFDCSKRSCKLRPGSHTLGLTYVWSQTETKGQQTSKRIGSGILTVVAIAGMAFGAGGIPDSPAFPLKNSHCDLTMTFEAQAMRGYVLYAVHTIQKERPEEFQLLDAESGALVARAAPSCKLLYETAFAFSNESGSGDQCIIHLFMGKDTRVENVQFNLDGSDLLSATGRMAFSFTLEPGTHQISASIPGYAHDSDQRYVETSQIRCNAGETKYIQIEVEGFWTSKPVISEMSKEDARPLISKVASKSKLHEITDP